MILYPAIDIRDGKAVRLLQGDYERQTAYDDDPVDAALRWEDAGALWLHVVDLDGARAGDPVNLDQVRRIAAAVQIPIQVGGGLRDSGQVERAISAGAERIVLGTTAVRDHALVAAIVAAHGDRVVAAVDTRAGKVAAEGWTEPSETGPAELAARLWERGVERFLYTPVEVDGTMRGPAVGALAELAAATAGELLYSGGVGSLDDLRALNALELDSLGGVIVGRALYEQRFTIAEAQAVLSAADE